MTIPNVTQSTGLWPAILNLIAEWRAELAAFAQEKLSGPLGDRAQYIGIKFGDANIAINAADGDRLTALGRVSRQSDDAAALIAGIFLRSGEVTNGVKDVVVQLPSRQVLRARLELPAASPSTLRQAAFYELERLSPIDPGKVYFDLAILERDRARKKTQIEVRIVKRTVLDEAVAICGAADLSVGAIRFEDDPAEADRLYYPVDLAAYLRMRWRRFSIFVLAGVTVVLFLALLLAAYWRGAEQSSILADQADAARTRAIVIHRLQRDIRDTQAQIEFPAAQKRRPLVVEILSDLTRILPDGTWLTEFSITDNKVHIQGISKSASDLIGLIDKSPHFSNAQFDASLQSATDNNEHFDLSFEIGKPGSR